MKNKLIKTFSVIILISFLLNCKEENNSEVENTTLENLLTLDTLKTDSTLETKSKDSIELTALVRKVYKWYNLNPNLDRDFPYKFQNDSIFIGLDWTKYNKNMERFKKTNLFTEDFFKRHKDIAIIIDTSIKSATIEWRNINDGIPLWESNADDWCACQDNPDNYWEFMTIDDLKINKNVASFIWTWDKKSVKDKHEYSITAKKVNNVWKINKLAWLNHNYSIEEFDKIMND